MILNVLSPEYRLWEGFEIQALSLMTLQGVIQILPGHVPFIGELDIGPFSLTDKKGEIIKGAIAYGYVEVLSGDTISVYAETIELASAIDVDRAQKAYDKAQKLLNEGHLDEAHFLKYQKKLFRALARLHASAS